MPYGRSHLRLNEQTSLVSRGLITAAEAAAKRRGRVAKARMIDKNERFYKRAIKGKYVKKRRTVYI